MEFGKIKGFWKPSSKGNNEVNQKNGAIQNGTFHGTHASLNQNNSNNMNGKENFDDIEPEVTPDGYGLRTPYGTHLNLDFLKYCEDIAQGKASHTPQFRRPRTSSNARSRNMRLSMNAPSNESLDSLASDVTTSSDAGYNGEHADNTLMETRRRLEAFRSFRTKRKPHLSNDRDLSTPNQIKSPGQNMSSPPWASGQMTPNGFNGMISSINNLPPHQYHHVREQMVAALERLKELEKQVKQIPVLQVQVSVLQQEKRNLTSDIKRMKESKAKMATPAGKENAVPPPPPPKRKYKSTATGDEVSIHNVVCYAVGDNSISSLIPTKRFADFSSECNIKPPTASLSTQAGDLKKFEEKSIQCKANSVSVSCNTNQIITTSKLTQAEMHKNVMEKSIQCQPTTNNVCCNTNKVQHNSVACQINVLKHSLDANTQCQIQGNSVSCNTEVVQTSEIGIECQPVQNTISTNTNVPEPVQKHSVCTETEHVKYVDNSTETVSAPKREFLDKSVGRDVTFTTTLAGPDYQLCHGVGTFACQTDSDIIKPLIVDACVGNHVEHENKATDTLLSTQETATSMEIFHTDVCVGNSVEFNDEQTQIDKPETSEIGILAAQSCMTTDVSCGVDYVIQSESKLVECKPVMVDNCTDAWKIDTTSMTSVSTLTDDDLLGGKWTISKTTRNTSTNATVDCTNISTNTNLQPKSVDNSTLTSYDTGDQSSYANLKPDVCDAPVQVSNQTNSVSSQYDLITNKSLPHKEASAGDHIDALDKKSFHNESAILTSDVSTDTSDLIYYLPSEKTNNEIEEYVEKVSSLLEEQQNLLASKYGDFQETKVDEVDGAANATSFSKTNNDEINEDNIARNNITTNSQENFKNNDKALNRPIKSIMRKPGSKKSEKKFLRFAEGVKSDDDSSDSCSCSDESEECDDSECSEKCTSEESSSEEEDVTDAVVEVEDKKKSNETAATNESHQGNSEPVQLEPVKEVIEKVEEIQEQEVVVKTSCITDSFLEACSVVDNHMKNPWSVPKLDLEEAKTYLGNKWMAVAAQAESSAYHVEEFVDKLSETSHNLLMKVVNLTDASGNTALHYAISHQNFPVVSTLLNIEELDVNKHNQAGFTASMLAALTNASTKQEIDILKKLFKRADVNSHAKQAGQTALMLAVSHGRIECSEALLEAGAQVNAQDVEGSTALMCATEHGYVDLVKKLIAHPECDTTIKDHDGSTALNIAMDREHRDIAILLYAQMNYSKSRFSTFEELKLSSF